MATSAHNPSGSLTYYLDASLPIAVRRAIAECRDDVLFAGGRGAPTEDTDDDVWLPIAGAQDWVCVMRDKHIRTRPRERQAYIENGVRLFCLTDAGNATRWQVLNLLVRRWTRITETANASPGPYIYAVTLNRFEQLA
jgi:hypothetical protein